MQNILAILDIGSNSFHLIIASISQSNQIEIIERAREVIRLSADFTDDNKIIKSNSIELALQTINNFKAIASKHNLQIRAIATSALREAKNRHDFIKIIFQKTGVKIEIISGLEEARFINIGIMHALPSLIGSSLSVDIGGGSTEFIGSNKGEIDFIKSIQLGAVRLTQKYFSDLIISDKIIFDAVNHIEEKLNQIVSEICKKKYHTFIGTSGTILNIGMMIKAKRGEAVSDYTKLNNFLFTAKELFEIEEIILNEKKVEHRRMVLGLDEKRADIIPMGIIILSTIIRKLKIKKMIISNYALKEGVILDSLKKT